MTPMLSLVPQPPTLDLRGREGMSLWLTEMLEAGCLLLAAKGIASAPHHLTVFDAQRGAKPPSPR